MNSLARVLGERLDYRMLFNTREFLYVFLPLTVCVFYLLSRFRLLKLCPLSLVAASFIFYTEWKHSQVGVLIFSIAFNYTIALAMKASKEKPKPLLILGLAVNLLLLGYYKYWNFLLGNIHAVFSWEFHPAKIHLPLGISFYTFTQIAYLVDVYQKKTRPYSPADYTLFVVFFPHLIAGPIVHYSHVMPQFESLKKKLVQYDNLFKGAFYFILGLASKVLFANYLDPIANSGFANAATLSTLEAWKATLAYSFQIYFDFAGYSSMAIGLALLFNIRFPDNFNSPYQAVSIIDFWRRWHMTLSEFLRNYVYIPLGGNRKGAVRQHVNIFLTMLIGGVWHGASWTFVIWGFYHGVLIVANHLLEKTGFKLPKFWAAASTFMWVTLGWVFFKSGTLSQAGDMFRALFGMNAGIAAGMAHDPAVYAMFAVIATVAFFFPNAQKMETTLKSNAGKWTAALGVLFAASYFTLSRSEAPAVFLYWQF